MLQALLHGKLSREQENMEDVLTSEVFGLLRYVHPDDGLRPFISRAVSLSGDHLLSGASGGLTLRSIDFWPTFNEPGCLRYEPDVFVVLEDQDGTVHAIVIEAKYWSGKSNRDDADPGILHDQLAIQWHNLSRITELSGSKPALVYLTTHMRAPHDELAASERDWRQAYASEPPMGLYWLSWRELCDLFSNSHQLALRDIAGFTVKLNLAWFRGFSVMPQSERITWVFGDESHDSAFSWAVSAPSGDVTWRFQGE